MAFNYGSYDPTVVEDIVFSESKNYVEPTGETETRKQLSYPLGEIRDYLNETTVPSGGSTGQVLKKASGTDFDMVWQNVSDVTASMSSGEVDFTNGTYTLKFRVLTASQYSSITKDPNTLYFIKEE